MKLIFFIFILIVEFILLIISVIKYKAIKAIKRKGNLKGTSLLYGHEIESFIDTYLCNSIFLFIDILGWIIFLFITSYAIKTDMLIYIVLMVLIFFMPIFIHAMMTYAFSEIKHLSPENCLYKKDIKGEKYYKFTSIYGFMGSLTIAIKLYMFGFIVGTTYITTIVVIFIFGMGDLLQKDGYNDETSTEKSKVKFVCVRNIFRFILKKQFRNRTILIMKKNIRDIYLGLKEAFCIS